MKRLLLSLTLLLAARGYAEITQESLTAALQAKPEAFTEIELKGAGPVDFDLKLGESVVDIEEEEFDGLRFTAPEGSDQLDFIWYFNAPDQWSHWYVLPAKGEIKDGFRNWTYADRLYEGFDDVAQENQARVLQNLDAGYFTPGEEYILWFHRKYEGGDDHLRGRMMFAKAPEDGWDHEAYEETLNLPIAPVEAQVAALKSRGGEIMLDKEFFIHSDAVNRVDNIFTSLRMFQQMQGGFFIAVEISCPPCKTSPRFGDIRKKYGDPDFTRRSAEVAAKNAHPDQPDVQADADEITYYYDYFGFTVNAQDPDGKVIAVNTHKENYHDLVPDEESAASFGQLGTQNLTIFWRDGEEVGRMYFFLEKNKPPYVVQEPPVGKYRVGDTELEYLGDGQWTQTVFDEGRVFSVIPFRDHRKEGRARWYYEDGKLAFEVDHLGGLYHGDFIKYDREGNVLDQAKYDQGNPVK